MMRIGLLEKSCAWAGWTCAETSAMHASKTAALTACNGCFISPSPIIILMLLFNLICALGQQSIQAALQRCSIYSVPNIVLPGPVSVRPSSPVCPPKADIQRMGLYVRFSNRPFEVKHFQTIHHCSVDVAHGLALLFGIGTKALVWGFFSQEV